MSSFLSIWLTPPPEEAATLISICLFKFASFASGGGTGTKAAMAKALKNLKTKLEADHLAEVSALKAEIEELKCRVEEAPMLKNVDSDAVESGRERRGSESGGNSTKAAMAKALKNLKTKLEADHLTEVSALKAEIEELRRDGATSGAAIFKY